MYDQRSVAYTNKNILFVSHVVYQSRTIRIIHEYTERYGGYNTYKQASSNNEMHGDGGRETNKLQRALTKYSCTQDGCRPKSEFVMMAVIGSSTYYA